MDNLSLLRERLHTRKGEWQRIAAESGVSYRALRNVAHGANDPRSSTVAKLAEWCKANPTRGRRRSAGGASA